MLLQVFTRNKKSDSEYNSLRDPHLRSYFDKTPSARSHLVDVGLITEDGRVLATAAELWEGVKVTNGSQLILRAAPLLPACPSFTSLSTLIRQLHRVC